MTSQDMMVTGHLWPFWWPLLFSVLIFSLHSIARASIQPFTNCSYIHRSAPPWSLCSNQVMLPECQETTTRATWPLRCMRAPHSHLLLSRFTVHMHVPMPQAAIPLLRRLSIVLLTPPRTGPGDSVMDLETMPLSLTKPFLIPQVDICLFLFVSLQYI